MGCIESPVLAINRVRFNAMKAVEGVTDIARITKSGVWVVYVLTKRGAVYTNGSIGRNISLTGSTGEEATALLGLGLITKAELVVHKKWIVAHRAWRSVNDDLHYFNKKCERFGIFLDNAQTKLLTQVRHEADQTIKSICIEADRLNADRRVREAKTSSKETRHEV